MAGGGPQSLADDGNPIGLPHQLVVTADAVVDGTLDDLHTLALHQRPERAGVGDGVVAEHVTGDLQSQRKRSAIVAGDVKSAQCSAVLVALGGWIPVREVKTNAKGLLCSSVDEDPR